jgi:hypothetical protein
VGGELSVACGRERLARVEALRIEAEKAAETFARWWNEKYGGLAREVAEGLALERIARNARAVVLEVTAEASADPDVAGAGGIPDRTVPALPVAHAGGTAMAPRRLICLPSTEPGRPTPCGTRSDRTVLTVIRAQGVCQGVC